MNTEQTVIFTYSETHNGEDILAEIQKLEKFIIYSSLTHFSPVSHFYTPENVRKPNVFWRFQGV